MLKVFIRALGMDEQKFQMEEGSTVNDLLSTFGLANPDKNTGNSTVYLGTTPIDNTEQLEDLKFYTLGKKLDGGNIIDESGADNTGLVSPEDVAVVVNTVEKKKDIFTKLYCAETPDEVLEKDLITWALEQKAKNKYLQERSYDLLGIPRPPKDLMVGTVAYTVSVMQEPLRLTTDPIPQFGNAPYTLTALPEETESQLVKRFNTIM